MESIGGEHPRGHRYTAEEVRTRLEIAKREGELMKDARGTYHSAGVSGFSGTTSPYYGSSGYPPSHRQVKYEGEEIAVKQYRRFSINEFVRAGLNDLKAYFKKKEIKHG